MPELRHDLVSGAPVLLAPGRAARPRDGRSTPAAPPGPCPFCPGNEALTPPEVARVGPGGPGEPGWLVRVVPNKYPIVTGEVTGGFGAHEVVVLSPDHERGLGALDDEQAIRVLSVLRDRSAALLASGARFVQAFVNHGPAGGASLDHPHAQLLALGFVPVMVAQRWARTRDGDPVGADLQRARTDGLVVLEVAGAVAWCPWGSPETFAIRLAAPGAGPRFETADDDSVASVARALREALGALAATGLAGSGRAGGDRAGPDYNVVVRSAPPDTTSGTWHVDVVPRLSPRAGFELGTGIEVSTVDPVVAAEALRAGRAPG